jgi:hypothetical protein
LLRAAARATQVLDEFQAIEDADAADKTALGGLIRKGASILASRSTDLVKDLKETAKAARTQKSKAVTSFHALYDPSGGAM